MNGGEFLEGMERLLFRAIPFAPIIQIPRHGVYEDTIMFGVGIYAVVMSAKNWKARPVRVE
jgi:hypothetical protein